MKLVRLRWCRPPPPRTTDTPFTPLPPAYVLGQMQHPASVEGLKARLQDAEENYMVRHECAEALGSIAHDDVRWGRALGKVPLIWISVPAGAASLCSRQ